jgi:acetyl esterase
MLAMPGPPAHEVPVEQARAGHEAETKHLSGPGEPVAEVRDLEIPAPSCVIPARLYRPPERDGPLPLVVYLHGGGWMIGSIESFDTVVRALANRSGAIVVSVGYRLAPEAPFPAGLEDCLCAVRWLAANASELGADPERMAIAGDSAGGNLATVVARRLRGEVPLRAQALIYPVADAGCNTASYRDFGEGHGLTAASMQRFWNVYLDGSDGMDPDASPLRADDLDGCPPAFVLTAGFDPLRDEGEAYAEALREAGVEVDLRRYDGAIHGFWRWLAVARLSHRAIDEVAGALRARLA